MAIVPGAGKGSRNVDQDRMVEIIRAVLETELTDDDVRRALRLEDEDLITQEFREVAARKKARVVYQAILAGWRLGSAESLKNEGGVWIGEMLRIGGRDKFEFDIVAKGEDDIPLADAGIVMHKRPAWVSGWYAYSQWATAEMVAEGWVVGDRMAGAKSEGGFYGPLENGDLQEVPYPWGPEVVKPNWYRFGRENEDVPGTFYLWAYFDAQGVEKLPSWDIRRLYAGGRLGSVPGNEFFLELNGIDVDLL